LIKDLANVGRPLVSWESKKVVVSTSEFGWSMNSSCACWKKRQFKVIKVYMYACKEIFS